MIVGRFAFLLALALGCGGRADGRTDRPAGGQDSAPAQPSTDRSSDRRTVLFLGTSLTAGYGLSDPALAYPALIQVKLDSAGRPFRVINAGISGESSAGALARTDWLLRQNHPDVLVIETGANDGLRGQNPDSVRGRIQQIIDHAMRQDPPPKIVLLGMEALPNLGADYSRRFRAIYPALARANGAVLVPFLLADVAGVDSLNQDDGIHPTPAGQRVLAKNVWKAIEQVTRR